MCHIIIKIQRHWPAHSKKCGKYGIPGVAKIGDSSSRIWGSDMESFATKKRSTWMKPSEQHINQERNQEDTYAQT